MKRIFIVMLAFVCVVAANAQYRDVKLPEKTKPIPYSDLDSKQTGFWCAFEAEGASSVMNGRKNMQFAVPSFTGGYRFNEYIRVGVGLGARIYVNNKEVKKEKNMVEIPIYANARGNFVSAYDRDGVPFWSVNIGGTTSEGFYFNPTIGLSFGGLRNNFLVGVSYTLQSFRTSDDVKTAYSYFGVKIGYEF